MSRNNFGDELGDFLFGLVFISPLLIFIIQDYTTYKNIVKHKTKIILASAHEQAVAGVDTINYNDIVIDTKIAYKDSVRTEKQLRKTIKKGEIYNKPDSVCHSQEYRQYCEAIKQLEIARRQQKIK